MTELRKIESIPILVLSGHSLLKHNGLKTDKQSSYVAGYFAKKYSNPIDEE